MTNISVYTSTAEELEKLAEDNDLSIAEVVDALMDFVDELDL